MKKQVNKLSDFKVGDVVTHHYEQYSVKTRNYTPASVVTRVVEIGELGVTIETESGKTNPDYNLHVGSGCLDSLEKHTLQVVK
jgi:hypothetical protein